jgi:hypothetical protein
MATSIVHLIVQTLRSTRTGAGHVPGGVFPQCRTNHSELKVAETAVQLKVLRSRSCGSRSLGGCRMGYA